MKRVLQIGNTKSKSARRLAEEAKALDITFDVVPAHSILLDVSKTNISVASSSETSFDDYDVYFFRGIGSHEKVLRPIAQHLVKKGKRIVERRLPAKGLPLDKILLPSRDAGFNIVPYTLVSSLTNENLKTFTYPVIAKSVEGSLGKKVRLVNSFEELSATFEEFGRILIVQEYLELEYDIRVFVIGGEVVGALKRFRTEDNFLTTSRGGRREATDVTEHVRECALRATEFQDLEIAGVDIVIHEGKPQVFEVNSSPQFHAIEKHTGINIARKIVEYLVA